MAKIFLDPYGGEAFKDHINNLAEKIIYGIDDGSYQWDDDDEGYVVPIGELDYDFPEDDNELATIGEKLADALPERIEELGVDLTLESESVIFRGDIIVVS